ncbi:hypothetical protein LCGC14_1227250 [marine sediment metagenome]|uniref:Uncharacterized protein n=1 Tax=marine sediment metagenome TaxID=412755 RepID=A0A0F9NRU2_9ZZZZ
MGSSKTRPIFWISGNYYDCQRSWHNIVSMVKDPRITVLHCGYPSQDDSTDTAGSIIRLLRGKDIFNTRPHIIKVKGIPPPYNDKDTGYKLLPYYLKYVNNNKILVIDGPIGYYSKPPSKRFNSVKTSKFYKAIKQEGKVLEHPTEARNSSEAVKWFTEVCESFGVKIERPAALLVVEMKGRDLDSLYSVALTIKDYKKIIVKEDIEDICVSVFQKTVWDLITAIDSQDYESAIVHLQRFYQEPVTEHEFFGSVMQLLGALHYHFQILLLLKDGGQSSLSYKQVEKILTPLRQSTKECDAKLKDGVCSKCGWKGNGENCSNKWHKPLYTPQAIAMTVKNAGIGRILQLSRGNIYLRFADIEKVRLLTRTQFSNNVPGIRMCLDTLIMVLCGRCSDKEINLARGILKTQVV